jgi:hypothetical protein
LPPTGTGFRVHRVKGNGNLLISPLAHPLSLEARQFFCRQAPWYRRKPPMSDRRDGKIQIRPGFTSETEITYERSQRGDQLLRCLGSTLFRAIQQTGTAD